MKRILIINSCPNIRQERTDLPYYMADIHCKMIGLSAAGIVDLHLTIVCSIHMISKWCANIQRRIILIKMYSQYIVPSYSAALYNKCVYTFLPLVPFNPA